MKDKVEIWITTDCTEVIRAALLNRGIAMGNEYRFDQVGWKIIVTRTADLFLEVLKGALEHRITAEYPDVQPLWRMALGKDELLLVPPGEDRQRELERIRQVMGFLRELLYTRKFVALTLRSVLSEAIGSRWEEKLLAGQLDREAAVAKLVADLNAMDIDEAAAAAEAAAASRRPAAAEAPKTTEAPVEAGTEEQAEKEQAAEEDDANEASANEADADQQPEPTQKRQRKRKRNKGE